MSSPLPTVRDDFESRDPDFIRQFLPLFWPIASFWFRAEMRGLEKIPPEGPVLLVGNPPEPAVDKRRHHTEGATKARRR
jgi:hypothetical protein